MEIRTATKTDDIARAVSIDEAEHGSNARSDYIASVAGRGGLSVASLNGGIRAFCCLDDRYFFGKPFVSLLMVSRESRRLGLGSSLLGHQAAMFPEIWTSTNQSKSAMRQLLDKLGWRYCGEVIGLDEGDPERFYRNP